MRYVNQKGVFVQTETEQTERFPRFSLHQSGQENPAVTSSLPKPASTIHSTTINPQGLIKRWQYATNAASRRYKSLNTSIARRWYLSALDLSERLLQTRLCAEHLAIHVVSLHNLADLESRLRRFDQARSYHEQALNRLFMLMRDNQDKLTLLFPHLHRCKMSLALFCRHYGSSSASNLLLRQSIPIGNH
ncbi:tetratricopeptide repeat protein [Bowmanella pacifica]|uniref:Uncharacterized protein n=1 Tax=Bowmanella pacifica TaxID=502051 RepID=A0A917Z4Y1_9ALTE|nr:tetratricopeptide repeat protein [Bowmanella pacifica]GGO74062.1 hypothetical protein GCM10010982_35990 [Bowmanella pacifica]